VRALRPTPPRTVVFRAAAVTMVFGDTIALWDVDLAGRSGEVVAIHGVNGSGKTTLLRIVAGLAAPTRGHVGWTTNRPGGAPRIGLLGHANHLFDELTPIENVTLAARLARRDEALALDFLGRLGVAPSAARRSGDLSAGTRRRVGLARVLATDPDVVAVDEPFAGLDRAATELVAQALAASRDEGRLVLIATHDDVRSRDLATTSVWLEEGRLRAAPGKAPEAVTS